MTSHAVVVAMKAMTSHAVVFQIVLRPSDQGWGFTLLHNTKPVRVGRVKPDSVARRAGLHNADVIAAINQTPTLNLSAAEIASLIR